MNKWNRILNGERVVCSHADMDSFPFHVDLVSVPNPERIGTLDTFLVWLPFLVWLRLDKQEA